MSKTTDEDSTSQHEMLVKPIGFLRTCFKTKNGTPRQPSVSPFTNGYLTIEKSIFTNPDHSLEGLKEFSHVWVMFHFHLNDNKGVKAKVRPPRLNGSKVGVFATRSPHRPNPIGLTLAKLDRVEGQTVHLSGLDIVDGTPVIDIKPYISQYDIPNSIRKVQDNSDSDQCSYATQEGDPNASGAAFQHSSTITNESSQKTNEDIKSSDWIKNPPLSKLNVIFTARAEKDISNFQASLCVEETDKHRLQFFTNAHELRDCIVDILKEDPRSTYRRNKCSDRLYYISIDSCHITAWFDYSTTPPSVEVLRVKPLDDMADVLKS